MYLCQDYQISFIQIDPNNSLTRNPTHKLDFIIMTFCGITEPDPIPWFPKWSTGKILILLWSAFGLIMNLTYQCNLRAMLTTVEYEKPIESLRDLLDRGKRVYIPADLFDEYIKEVMKAGNSTVNNEVLQTIALAEKTNGLYWLTLTKGDLPPGTVDDVKVNGSSYLAPR